METLEVSFSNNVIPNIVSLGVEQVIFLLLATSRKIARSTENGILNLKEFNTGMWIVKGNASLKGLITSTLAGQTDSLSIVLTGYLY